jgi:hypothetical protein
VMTTAADDGSYGNVIVSWLNSGCSGPHTPFLGSVSWVNLVECKLRGGFCGVFCTSLGFNDRVEKTPVHIDKVLCTVLA